MRGELPELLYVVADLDHFVGTEEMDYEYVTDGQAVGVYELRAVKTVSLKPALID